MDDKAKDYRSRAQEAERLGERTTDPVAKRAYTQLAESYKQLADLAERGMA